jgi:hypothetical protein
MPELQFDDLIPPKQPPPTLFETMWDQAWRSVAPVPPGVAARWPLAPPSMWPQTQSATPAQSIEPQAPSPQRQLPASDSFRSTNGTEPPVTLPSLDEVYFHDLIPDPGPAPWPLIHFEGASSDAPEAQASQAPAATSTSVASPIENSTGIQNETPASSLPLSNDGGRPFAQAELRASNLSASESIKYLLLGALTNIGLKRFDAQHLAEGLTGLLGTFYPPAGVTMALDDMQRAARRGDAVGTIAAAIGVVPGARLRRPTPLGGAATAESARKAAQLAVNVKKGKAFEVSTGAKLMQIDTRVSPQVTVETPTGARARLDFVSEDASGVIKCTECKASAAAPVRSGQATAFKEIARAGATVVGKGKPGFTGGTVLPPTTVDIVRPRGQP